ncbi:MAG: PocR ligand-binding domain-containing protein [Firmicutes bacterium]|nr:PocR ligand-binding domain-containing protein [Bacillota bacterium]
MFRYKKKDETEFDAEVLLKQVTISGEPHIMAIIRDITEKRQSEMQIAKYLNQLAEAERTAHLGSCDLDLTTGEAVWSDELFRIFGIDPSSINTDAQTGKALTHPEDQSKVEEAFEKALATGNDYSVEKRIIRPDGEIRWVQSLGKIIQKEGKPSKFIRSFLDVTERKQAEEKLQKSQAILTKVLNSVPQAIFWKDKNSVFLGCNKVFAQIFGAEHPDEVIGKNDFDFFGSKRQKEAYRKDDQIAMEQKRTVRNIIEPVEQRNGKIMWVSTTKVPLLDSSGEVFGVLGVFDDITERKEAEEALQEKIKEIERFNKLAVDRESRIIELKKEVNQLSSMLGISEPYPATISPWKSDEFGFDTEEIDNTVNRFNFSEMLNTKKIQQLLDALSSSIGISTSVIDTTGKIIIASSWKHICVNFYRANPVTQVKCIESDTKLAAKIQEGKDYAFYRCQNGLYAAAAPIKIGSEHVANVFIGQFLTDQPDMEFFRDQAKEHGFDEETFLTAIKQVPIMGEAKIKSILSFVSVLASLITSLSYNAYKIKAAEAALKIRAEELNRRRAAAISFAEDAEQARKEIADYKDHLEEIVNQRTSDLDDARMAALSLMQDANLQRQRVEEALEEKEVLLREIHHRVKNNLNSISNLLYLQSRSITDKHTASALQESQNRIHSMARVHEHLYRSDNIAKIDIQPYIEEMTADLSHSLTMGPVIMKVEAYDIMLDVDRAIPFGLLVNELITNALKHAFSDYKGHNIITINLEQKKKNYILEVSDNGDGLPGDFRINQVKSLGLRLVTMLVKQLQGTLDFESAEGHGTLFRVVFPE